MKPRRVPDKKSPKQRRKACPSGKIRYKTRNDTKTAIAGGRQNRADGKDYVPVRAYPCNLCNGFHLTSQPLERP